MKKALVFALLVALMVSLAVPAAAATSSATGSADDLKPVVVPTTPVEGETEDSEFLVSADTNDFAIFSPEEVEELTEEAQETFAESKEALADAAPEGMAARYFFYCVTEESTAAVFEIDEYDELVIMQYINGEWIMLEFTINADGTITVHGIVDAPMAIFVK